MKDETRKTVALVLSIAVINSLNGRIKNTNDDKEYYEPYELKVNIIKENKYDDLVVQVNTLSKKRIRPLKRADKSKNNKDNW